MLEAVPIGAGTYLDGKFFVWLRQKLLKSVRIPASFFLARQKIFLANLYTVIYWYSFLMSSFRYFAPLAMPAAAEIHCPREPVDISTPGTVFMLGCPYR